MHVSMWMHRDGIGPTVGVFISFYLWKLYGLNCNDFIDNLYL